MSHENPRYGDPLTFGSGATVAQHSKSLLKILAVLFVGITVFLAIPAVYASSGSGSSGEGNSETPDPDEHDDHDDSDDDERDENDRDDEDRSGSGGGSSDDDGDHDGSSGGSDDSESQDDDSDQRGSRSLRTNDGENTRGLAARNQTITGNSARTAESVISRAELRMETAENKRGERIRRGEIVVVSSRNDLAAVFARDGLRIIEVFRLRSIGMNGYRISVRPRESEEGLLVKIKKSDPNCTASFNHVYWPASRPTIALANKPSTAARAALTSARIGLVDARVDSSHPMLRKVHVSTREFGLASSDEYTHGTAVASRIAEVAPGANIVVASVFSELQNGDEIASVDAIVRGLDWLSRNEVPVMNLSLTGPANPVLQAVTSKLIAKGHVLVAAVGNEGPHAAPQYPAAYAGVVGVTAVDENNRVYIYANQGPFVDFAAPGVNTQVATASGSVETASGTSYAAPVVAVALARLLSKPDERESRNAQQKLADGAKDLGEPGRDHVYGFGVIDPNPD